MIADFKCRRFSVCIIIFTTLFLNPLTLSSFHFRKDFCTIRHMYIISPSLIVINLQSCDYRFSSGFNYILTLRSSWALGGTFFEKKNCWYSFGINWHNFNLWRPNLIWIIGNKWINMSTQGCSEECWINRYGV